MALDARPEDDQIEKEFSKLLIPSANCDQCQIIQTVNPVLEIMNVAVSMISTSRVTRL